MLPDRISNPAPLTYESGALPIALRGPARFPMLNRETCCIKNSRSFSNVQLDAINISWMHLINTVKCRYAYTTPTVQILHCCDHDGCINEVFQP